MYKRQILILVAELSEALMKYISNTEAARLLEGTSFEVVGTFPLDVYKRQIEAQRGWTPDVFGMYGSSEFIFNVFGFLILAGIILDKMGVRYRKHILPASLLPILRRTFL